MTAWADQVALAWVRRYTHGLAPDVAQRRVDELRSEVFEHGAFAGTNFTQQVHVLGRVLWGIPADLSWRRAARASRDRRLVPGGIMTLRRATTVLVVFVALFNLWAGVGVWIGAGADDGTEGGGARYGLPLFFAAALVCYGLWCRASAPRRSTVAIVVGAALPTAVLPWMAPLFVPAWLAVSALVIATEPRRRGEPAMAAS